MDLTSINFIEKKEKKGDEKNGIENKKQLHNCRT
jgi:hypothetical protein